MSSILIGQYFALCLLTVSGILTTISCSFLVENTTDINDRIRQHCQDILKLINDCWLKYTDLPSCDKRSRLATCAELYNSLPDECDSETVNQVIFLRATYKKIDNLVCNKSQLFGILQWYKPCWMIVRSCAFHLMTITGNITEHKCRNLFRIKRHCDDISLACQPAVSAYWDVAWSASSCWNYSFVEDDYVDCVDYYETPCDAALILNSFVCLIFLLPVILVWRQV